MLIKKAELDELDWCENLSSVNWNNIHSFSNKKKAIDFLRDSFILEFKETSLYKKKIDMNQADTSFNDEN